eukprot:gnl/TRDRNA2_/TRDRNA2_93339_c2_seq1.p1 gnl/TRDRNA2_/TRDRNA2_93339_c2~~gnl/TRDRNA2_/TRDRNA2_93339_c2_seq1.p1  ORF type:complete len:667 (-),score=77.25 gnl/TRDRNA2_/TRDRNA2_93339_c2_seq1:50-2005(-)
MSSVAWASNGYHLAVGGDDSCVRIWDADSDAAGPKLDGHVDCIQAVAWAHDSEHLASGSLDGTIRLWSVCSSLCLGVLEGHTGAVLSVAWARGLAQRLASGSADGTVRIWDLVGAGSSGTIGGRSCVLSGHLDAVHAVDWASQGGGQRLLASGSADGTVRLWDTDAARRSSASCRGSLDGHRGRVLAVAWGPRRRLASGGGDMVVCLWDSSSGMCERVLTGHFGPIRSIAWCPGNSQLLASGSDDMLIRLWDVDDGHCESVFRGHADDMLIRLWDVDDGHCESVFRGHAGAVRSVSWARDGRRLASVGADGTARIWAPATHPEASVGALVGGSIALSRLELQDRMAALLCEWLDSADPDSPTPPLPRLTVACGAAINEGMATTHSILRTVLIDFCRDDVTLSQPKLLSHVVSVSVEFPVPRGGVRHRALYVLVQNTSSSSGEEELQEFACGQTDDQVYDADHGVGVHKQCHREINIASKDFDALLADVVERDDPDGETTDVIVAGHGISGSLATALFALLTLGSVDRAEGVQRLLRRARFCTFGAPAIFTRLHGAQGLLPVSQQFRSTMAIGVNYALPGSASAKKPPGAGYGHVCEVKLLEVAETNNVCGGILSCDNPRQCAKSYAAALCATNAPSQAPRSLPSDNFFAEG